MVLFILKCFSITFAPKETEDNDAISSAEWSEKPTIG